MNTKKIFIICTVRGTTHYYRKKLEYYVKNLEAKGHEVHLPHRDTNQNVSSIGICTQNYVAIKDADEVHIFYSSESSGTHFDMGMAFALQKPIVVVENEEHEKYDEEGNYKKSFSLMLEEWENKCK